MLWEHRVSNSWFSCGKLGYRSKNEKGNSGCGHSRYEDIGDYDIFKEKWNKGQEEDRVD